MGGGILARVRKLFAHLRTDADATLRVAADADGRTLTRLCKVVLFVFILFLGLGLVVMGRHKCEVITCLSSQTQCEFMNCYIVY